MDSKFKNLFSRFSAVFFNNGALKVAFFAVLLFIGISHVSVPVEHSRGKADPAGNNVYTGILTVNRDCEAPALRYRLGQQLQLNFRSARPGQSWNLQRTGHLEGKLLPDFCRQIIAENSFSRCKTRENSTYPVYSTFSFPVRAGPQFSTTEQSFSV